MGLRHVGWPAYLVMGRKSIRTALGIGSYSSREGRWRENDTVSSSF
jgi:hypothetical protein